MEPAAAPGPASPSGRAGLDEELLGVRVPLPVPTDPGVATVRLDYTHVSVLMRPDRRLAAVTGVGLDGARLFDLDRSGIDWRLDPRLPADQRAPHPRPRRSTRCGGGAETGPAHPPSRSGTAPGQRSLDIRCMTVANGWPVMGAPLT